MASVLYALLHRDCQGQTWVSLLQFGLFLCRAPYSLEMGSEPDSQLPSMGQHQPCWCQARITS